MAITYSRLGNSRYSCHSCSWPAEEKNYFFLYPRSRLKILSCETSSAVPSRVRALIHHTQAESGAYSRDFSPFPRFPPRCPPIPLNVIAIGSVSTLSGHAIIDGIHRQESIDAPSPEGRAKSLGKDDIERIVLTARHWGKHKGTSRDAQIQKYSVVRTVLALDKTDYR